MLPARKTVVNKTDSTVILPCRSVMLKQDELAFIKALSTLHRRLVTSQKKKKIPTVSAGRRSTPSGSVSRASQRITGSVKPTSLLARATLRSQSTGAQRLELGPSLCPRPPLTRANKLLPSAGNPVLPG